MQRAVSRPSQDTRYRVSTGRSFGGIISARGSRDARLQLDWQAGKLAIFHGERRCASGELAAEFGTVLRLVVPDAYFFVVSGNRKTNGGDGIANCVSNPD